MADAHAKYKSVQTEDIVNLPETNALHASLEAKLKDIRARLVADNVLKESDPCWVPDPSRWVLLPSVAGPYVFEHTAYPVSNKGPQNGERSDGYFVGFDGRNSDVASMDARYGEPERALGVRLDLAKFCLAPVKKA